MTSTTAAQPATSRSTRRPSVLRTVTIVLLVAFGTLKLAATTFFVFFATAEQGGDPQGLFDWSVGVWSWVLGAGYLVIATGLGRGRSVVPLTLGLAAADVAFSFVKFFVYDEPEAAGFLATTLILTALVVASARSRRG
jgi:hypothetical protein